MDISISLSEPLLVLRQRSDTINTLLVEDKRRRFPVARDDPRLLVRDAQLLRPRRPRRRVQEAHESHQQGRFSFRLVVTRSARQHHDLPLLPRRGGLLSQVVVAVRRSLPSEASLLRNREASDEPSAEKHQRECGGVYHLIKSPKPIEKKVDSYFKKCLCLFMVFYPSKLY